MGSDTVGSVPTPPPATGVDEATISAAARGEEDAWARIYHEFSPTLLRYLKVHGTPDPEDALGDVFLVAAQNIARFEGTPGGFRSWLFTIAHHRMVDHVRRSQRRPPTDSLNGLLPDNDVLDLAARGPSIDERVEGRLDRAQVHALLHRLAPDQRDVFLLVYVADMSLVDAAAVLGKNVGAVKALHLRGLTTLKRVLSITAKTLV